MTTTVTLTGTGVPHPSPGRAGAGVLVRHGDSALQFDAGRATVLRLVEAGCAMHQLDALFVTHLHSDHLVDLADVVMTRWIQQVLHPSGTLPIVVPEGDADRSVAYRQRCRASGGRGGAPRVGRRRRRLPRHHPRWGGGDLG